MITHRILGMISGSSLDGVDLAHCTFHFERTSNNSLKLLNWQIDNAQTIAFAPEWYRRLSLATDHTALELLKLDREFGEYLGKTARIFILENGLNPDCITSHGHTVHHYPEQGFTCQIGAGSSIAETSGFNVINGFRDQDISQGGQGAPIAPIADAWLFDPDITFFLNLGGIANISCRTETKFLAFDITGANQILNALVSEIGLTFDKGGQLAASGQLNQDLLDLATQQEFFSQSYPKSLDNNWVKINQTQLFLNFEAPIKDKLFTACQLIGREIANAIGRLIDHEQLNKPKYRLLATGGGALNTFLVQSIQEHCLPLNVSLEQPEQQIIEFKEAAMIALMGALRIEKVPNVMASVTGAKTDTINGALFLVNSL